MEEKIAAAAIKFGRYVFTGVTHSDCGEAALSPGSFLPEERAKLDWVRDAVYGFYTTKARFVDRREAFKIAMEANQIAKWVPVPDGFQGQSLESSMVTGYAPMPPFIRNGFGHQFEV
jgi:hypothetical protein